MRKWTALTLALALMIGSADRANAGAMILTGSFDGTVGATSFSDASFTMTATFLGPSVVPPGFGVSSYPAALRVDIDGVGSFDSADASSTYAVVLGPPYIVSNGTYGLEIQPDSGALTAFYNSVTTVVLPSLQKEQVYSALASFEQSTLFRVALSNGDTLSVDNFDSLGATAALLMPEPPALGWLVLAVVATAWLRRPRTGGTSPT